MKQLDSRIFCFVFFFFFHLIFRRKIEAINFHSSLTETSIEPSSPILLLANHVSWWDGFILIFLARRLFPRHKFNVAMKYEEWSKRKWMGHLGALPIDSKSPSQLLRFFRNLKKERENNPAICLGYFFQGKMAVSGEKVNEALRGTVLLAEELAPITVIPVAIFADVQHQPKSVFYVRTGSPIDILNSASSLSHLTDWVNELNQKNIQDAELIQGKSSVFKSMGWKKLW